MGRQPIKIANGDVDIAERGEYDFKIVPACPTANAVRDVAAAIPKRLFAVGCGCTNSQLLPLSVLRINKPPVPHARAVESTSSTMEEIFLGVLVVIGVHVVPPFAVVSTVPLVPHELPGSRRHIQSI